MRPYQSAALAAFTTGQHRLFALLWERQSGKSSTFADMTLHDMIRHPWRTCIYASASLLLAQELPLKQSHRLHSTTPSLHPSTTPPPHPSTTTSLHPSSSPSLPPLDTRYSTLCPHPAAPAAPDSTLDPRHSTLENDAAVLLAAAQRGAAQAAAAGLAFHTANAHTDKLLPNLKPDDFAELFRAQKLEFRVYHDRSAFSRTKIIAPNLATARSWSGSVFLDEIAFIPHLRELMVALAPVISTNPDFKLVLATTPPEFDDSHYSFELLAPPPGLVFTPNPAGNWYESQSQIPVHRADAFDTCLAGKKIFDLRSGAEISPAEALTRAPNKLGHRIAHHLAWIAGGSAACDLLRLNVAQERGLGQCACFEIESDADFLSALNWLAAHLDPAAKTALGLDLATTTKGASNPTALAVAEDHPPEVTIRAFFVWKTRDPDLARERLRAVIETVARRPGGRPGALAVDATNERYFAEDLRRQFAPLAPVLLVVSSETYTKPGLDKPTNYKEFLGDQYLALLHDNHLTLPPEHYVRADHRLVLKDRGRFVCEPDSQGRHGDTFDAAKLALHALTHTSAALLTPAAFRSGPNVPNPRFSRSATYFRPSYLPPTRRPPPSATFYAR